jgi:hypothetical protein
MKGRERKNRDRERKCGKGREKRKCVYIKKNNVRKRRKTYILPLALRN